MRAAVALLAASLAAQSPPVAPTAGVRCSFLAGVQAGDINHCGSPCLPAQSYLFDPGECWLAAYCDPADARPIAGGILGNWVAPGGTCYWQCVNMQPGTTTPHGLGTAVVWFQFGTLSSAYFDFGLADPLWRRVFGSNLVGLFVPPYVFQNETRGSVTFDSWICPLPVPNDPTLQGVTVQCQAMRIDTLDAQFYVSSAASMMVHN